MNICPSTPLVTFQDPQDPPSRDPKALHGKWHWAMVPNESNELSRSATNVRRVSARLCGEAFLSAASMGRFSVKRARRNDGSLRHKGLSAPTGSTPYSASQAGQRHSCLTHRRDTVQIKLCYSCLQGC